MKADVAGLKARSTLGYGAVCETFTFTSAEWF